MDSDEILVARCRDAGDADAFADLVARHRRQVFRLALSILGQGFSGEAEEVTQEVFLRVHHSLGSFRGEAAFGSWLYRIAFNAAINLKQRVRYRAPHLSDQSLAGLAAPGPDPHDQLASAHRRLALAACIEELPDVYQSALRLHYWMGTPTAAIAELLDIPDNTVKSYLHRARRLLQVKLRERGYDHA